MLAAERAQVVRDLEQVERHLSKPRETEGELRNKLEEAQADFLQALGEAVVTAYKHDAEEFVRRNVLPLHTVAPQKSSFSPERRHPGRT